MNRTTHRRAVLATALLLAGAGGWLWFAQPSPPAPQAADAVAPVPTALPPVAALPVPAAARTPNATTPRSTSAIETPRSLAGSEIDGDAGVDAHGRLRIDRALRRLFDWHRAASGELGEPEILQWLTATLEQRLPPAAVAEALRIYDDYLAYLRASDAIVVAHDPLAQLDELHRMRLQILGDQVADAFFGFDELAQMARLERRRINDDPSLTESERLAQLRAYDERLPEELKPEGEIGIAQQAEALSRQYEADAVDAAERYRERAALLGEEAAQRLGALDAERDAWQQRMDAYAAKRARLQADVRLADSERERLLSQWAAGRFDEAELRRLLALQEAGGG